VKPSSRYFLSPNAATGILRRVASQDRELFAPLDAALRRLSKTEKSENPKAKATTRNGRTKTL
jgi:hypothetical protein